MSAFVSFTFIRKSFDPHLNHASRIAESHYRTCTKGWEKIREAGGGLT